MKLIYSDLTMQERERVSERALIFFFLLKFSLNKFKVFLYVG